ncbi:nuclear transport factor 2 family protein [Rhizobacter sp. P5_C2]
MTSDITETNRQLIERIFAQLAQGNGRALVDAMDDDFCWTLAGSSAWSGTWRGKQAVREQLLAPLFAQFEGTYTNTAERVIADGEHVAVQCRGHVSTKAGQRYDNHYCFVFRVVDGRLKEVVEYLDTALVDAVLQPPPVLPLR